MTKSFKHTRGMIIWLEDQNQKLNDTCGEFCEKTLRSLGLNQANGCQQKPKATKYKQMKRLIIAMLFLFVAASGQAQLKLSERVQYSKSANTKEKQLFLLDFWATWCGPCITAAEYLGVLQEQFSDDLYVISISKEAKKIVEKSLKNKPSKLAVSIDFDAENFTRYDIHSLPYSVLLNAEGKVLWTGNPTDLKAYTIKKYLKSNKKRIPIADFLKYEHYQQAEDTEKEIDGSFELETLTSAVNEYLQVIRRQKVLELEGTVQQLIAYLLGVSQVQIDYKGTSKKYRLSIRHDTPMTHKVICRKLLRKLRMRMKKMVSEGEVLFVKSVNPEKFWNSVQYNWGDNNAVFLEDDNQFMADNILCSTMLGKLGDLCKKPILMAQPIKDTKEHDWQIHYRFTDLMLENLADYGIDIEVQKKNYPSYFISNRRSSRR